jgi:phage/plasmid-associated DNA primase
MTTTNSEYGTEQPDWQEPNAPDDDDFGPIDPEELARKRKARAERKAKANGSSGKAEQPRGKRTNGSAGKTKRKAGPKLSIGDDVELAQHLANGAMQGVVYAEGEFWRYGKTDWKAIPQHEMSSAVHKLSGLRYGGDDKRTVSLSGGRIKSILEVLADILAIPEFFAEASQGLNAANCFIAFENKKLVPHAHSPEHRQRHTALSHWQPGTPSEPPEGSLLAKLLTGIFKSDPQAEQKTRFLQQIAFVAAAGYSTRLKAPKAIILLGRTAENGKSQVLDMLEGLLPPGAVSSIPPHRFDDDNKMRMLIGTALNTSGELATGAIAGDRFKMAVTGDRLDVRGAYKPDVVQFRPQALQVLAGNKLPPFKGGFDRGVRRRLAAIEFLNTFAPDERIEFIGKRITQEEADYLLAWALGGAEHILNAGTYDEPPCSAAIIAEWTQTADPVLGWIADRVLPPATLTIVGEEPKPKRTTSAAAFLDFRIWHQAEEGRTATITQRTFTDRVQAQTLPGVRYIPGSNGFRGFEGLRLAKPTEALEDTELGGRQRLDAS